MKRFFLFLALLAALAVASWLGLREPSVRTRERDQARSEPVASLSEPELDNRLSRALFVELQRKASYGAVVTTPAVEQATWAAVKTDQPLSALLQQAGLGNVPAELALSLYLRTHECEREAAALDGIEGSSLAAEMQEQALVTMSRCDRKPERASIEWLAVAADMGSAVARRAYYGAAVEQVARDAPDQATRDAIGLRAATYLRDALASGDAMALREIAALFSDGVFADADPVASAAFMSALARTGVFRPAQMQAEQGMAALDPESRRRAEQLAEKVLRTCCS